MLFVSLHVFNPLGIAKKKCTTLGNPTATDSDGFLLDVEVQSGSNGGLSESREDKRRDVDQFFHPPVLREVKGRSKKYCICKICL